ncbi:ATP-binding protein [Streptomyces sp. NPDC059506]|uniref:ATP-binding protein n=1 Tax=Streptomyces TaxID=1883 RepID=UPI00367DC69D
MKITEYSRPALRFGMLFTSSTKGARLSRRIAVSRLTEWGYATDTAELLISELATNAVTHCCVPQRWFLLRMDVHRHRAGPDTLRVEASDSCADHHPKPGTPTDEDESGRGLLLVDALATAWGSYTRSPEAGVGKTVWAECVLETAQRASEARPR